MINSERTIKTDVLERAALTLALGVLFFAGYFTVGLSTIPGRAHEFTTSLDKRIPFIASSVWIYIWSYTASVIPLFLIRCHRLFRRTFIAYAAAICVALICFTTFPVTALHLRLAASSLGAADPSDWAVSAIYSVDPPYNLFPSLHVCLTALAAIAAWKANRWYGVVLVVCLGSVVISVCTIKQHFAVDALGGLALAALAGGIILRPYDRQGVKAVYSWRGPAIYLLSLGLMYVGFYAAYLRASRGRSHRSPPPSVLHVGEYLD